MSFCCLSSGASYHKVSFRLLNITQMFPSKSDSTSPSRFTFCHCTEAPTVHLHPSGLLNWHPFYTLPFCRHFLDGLRMAFPHAEDFIYHESTQMSSLWWSLPPHSPFLFPEERVRHFLLFPPVLSCSLFSCNTWIFQ